MHTPQIGDSLAAVDTPALIIDLNALERNIARMNGFCRDHGVNWRPHAKSYKSSALVRKVVEGGAIGVTCAKLGEAEVYARAGVTDLLITSPLVGPIKMRRLAELRRIANPIAVVDHADHVVAIEAAAHAGQVRIRILIEIELGMNRCGIAPGEPAVELARRIAASPHLELAGIMGWEGHLLLNDDLDDRTRKIRAALELLAETRDAIVREGMPCPIVSAGGTGSYQTTATLGIATEIQAGGGVLFDPFYQNRCHVRDHEFAVRLLATVMSRPAPNRAVLDFGRKSANPELMLPMVVGRTDLKGGWLSAEHAVYEVLEQPGPRIGDRVELLPGYGDWTTLLHDRYYAFRDERLEAIWELDARGRAD